MTLAEDVDAVARENNFSGVVRIDRDDEVMLARAYGYADRAHEVPNTLDTIFATASGTKGLTALTVMSLVDDGLLALSTTGRSLLVDDLPLVDDHVTVEHLLAHRSGIGDYLDEEREDISLTDYVMSVPVHELAETEDYVKVLDGHPAKFAPDERFGYSNGGYVLLALISERATGVPFAELVRRRVTEPAGMTATEFHRSDELPATAAIGYLTERGPRTNVFHLPVRGSGDGGIYTTAGDMSTFWQAFFAGRIVRETTAAEMMRPRSDAPPRRYGLGFWLDGSSASVMLIGTDAGVSFRSVHDPSTHVTQTVISNTTTGARAIARFLDERL